jgi:hypothetical protein
MNIGVLVFPVVEELDFVGLLEQTRIPRPGEEGKDCCRRSGAYFPAEGFTGRSL